MTYDTNDALFYSSMDVALSQDDPIRWLDGYNYALIDLSRESVDEVEHRRQTVLFLQACLREQSRSTYNDRETVVLENSHV